MSQTTSGSQRTDDRRQRTEVFECGMRKEKKPKEVFEFGIGNAEGGFIRFRIWDFGFRILIRYDI